jgi:16S rRNA (cytidine1402-2'-O)-methyltransferase
MASKLKVVATPIGNVRDISARAIEELKKADLILAEDTRSALKLINYLGIQLKAAAKVISCHSQMEEHRATVVIERLNANENVLVLSDAGCPVISDPGSLLVQAVVNAGLDVEVIPGPSALTSAIMGAGIDTTRFAFLGFLPQKGGLRKKLILSSAEAELALVIYEAPQRIATLLKDLFELLGPRRVVVARELTKLYETFHRGELGQVLTPPFMEKGECVVVVEAGPLLLAHQEADQAGEIATLIENKIAEGLSTKDVTKLLVNTFHMKKSLAYDLVVKIMKPRAE